MTIELSNFREQAQHELARLRTVYQDLRATMAPWEAERTRLEYTMHALEAYLDDQQPATRRLLVTHSLLDQVVAVLRQHPAQGLSAIEVYEQLGSGKETATVNAIQQTLWRHPQYFHRPSRGVYVLRNGTAVLPEETPQ